MIVLGRIAVQAPATPARLRAAALALAMLALPHASGAADLAAALQLPPAAKLPRADNLATLADGSLSGTPSQPGVFRFTALVADAAGRESVGRFSVQVQPPAGTRPGFITNASLPGGEVGSAYPATQLGVAGLAGAATFRVVQGPPFLAVDAGGLVTGFPTEAGEFSIALEARDASGGVATRTYTIAVRQANRQRATDAPSAAIPDGAGMLDRSVTLGGAGRATEADLTADIRHPFAGDLSLTLITPMGDEVAVRPADGLPATDLKRTFARIPLPRPTTIAGTWTLRVRDLVRGDAGTLASFTLEVESAFTVSLDPLRTGIVGRPFAGGSAQLPIVGGVPPFPAPAVIAGQLPPGLELDISLAQTELLVFGTPTQAGAFSATVALTDSTGAVARVTLPITVIDVPASGAQALRTPADAYRFAPAAQSLQLAVSPDARTVFVHAAGNGGAMDDFLHVLDVPARTLRSFPTFRDPGSVRADQPAGLAVSGDGRFLYQVFLPTLQGGSFQSTLRKIRTADRSTVFEVLTQTGRRAVLRPDERLLLTTAPLFASVHDPETGASAVLPGFGDPDFVTNLGAGSAFFLFSPGAGMMGPMRALDTSNFPGALPPPVDMPQVPVGSGTAVESDPLNAILNVYVNAATSLAAPGGRIRRIEFLPGNPAGSPVFDFPFTPSLVPGGVALTPDFRHLYAPHTGGVAIFDTTMPAAAPTLVELGGPAGTIAVSPDNRRVFVTVPSLQRLVVLE